MVSTISYLPFRLVKKPRFSVSIVAPPYLPGHQDQEQHADRHVEAVEPGDHEEARAELGCAHRIAPGADAFFDDQLGPLKGLHADEGGAEERREISKKMTVLLARSLR